MTGFEKALRNNLWQCCSKYVLLVIKFQNVIACINIFYIFLRIMGLYLPRLISVGAVKNRQLTVGHYTIACSLPWTWNRNESGVDLVMLCYRPSCFSSAKRDNCVILTFCKQTRDHGHLHVKNRKVCNKTRSPQVSTLFFQTLICYELLVLSSFFF